MLGSIRFTFMLVTIWDSLQIHVNLSLLLLLFLHGFHSRLCEWSEAILAYRCIRAHCSANHLAPYVPPVSKTLSSLEETWLTLEKMLQKNRRVLSSKACSQHLKSAFEKKLSRKVL